MHERQTATNLLDGRPWACWGPPVESGRLTDRTVQLIARRSGQSIEQVAEFLLHSHDAGRYVLLRSLSITEHAAVYIGVDRLLAREVAVKIHRDEHKHATHRAIFESQAMARLEHPNIVRIHDMGEHQACMYSVIERCDADLHDWHVGRGWLDIIARVLEAGNGLAQLHAVGYVHGDVKPMNILIRDGVAKLADFGHVWRAGVLSPNLGGTVGFIAPELFERGPSFAADVFALAVTLWVCLFGELPYPAPAGDHVTMKTAFRATMQRALARELEPPASLPLGMPLAVLHLLELTLDPDPSLRPSLAAFMNRLRTIAEREQRRAQRRRWMPALAAAVAIVAGVGFVIGVRHRASGSGSIFWTAAAVVNPLARAEAAAHRGELDAAIGALYRVDVAIESLSAAESLAAARAAERIAEVLDQKGHKADARSAYYFAVRLYQRAGRPHEAERARKPTGDPQQNK